MPDAARVVRPPSSVVLYLRTAIKSVFIIVNITTKWDVDASGCIREDEAGRRPDGL
jgi:hypothetical protein